MRIKPETRRDIKVSMQMSRSSDGNFYLRIVDKASGLMVAEVRMNEVDFSDLMSTRTTPPLECEYYANPNVGKKLEVKRVEVHVENRDLLEKNLKLVYNIAEEDNPGFTADRDDYSFNRYQSSEQTYPVTLRRYV
jgi:hypothetical protein